MISANKYKDKSLIQPILFEPDKDIIITLERILLEQFNTSSIVTISPIKEVPDGLFNEIHKRFLFSFIYLAIL
jgi:hypothetical protein